MKMVEEGIQEQHNLVLSGIISRSKDIRSSMCSSDNYRGFLSLMVYINYLIMF